jgi:hypothetical protein
LEHVYLTLPHQKETLVIDVSTWKNVHPGGVHPFQGREAENKKDISSKFATILRHFGENQEIHEEVFSKIKKYTKGVLV